MEIITKTNGYNDGENASAVYIVSFSEKEQDYLQRCKFFHQVCSDRKHFDYESESKYLEEKEEFEYLTPEAIALYLFESTANIRTIYDEFPGAFNRNIQPELKCDCSLAFIDVIESYNV